MNARNKLNVAYLNGSLVLAGLIGPLTESGTIFVLALVGLLLMSLCSGDIRPNRRSR